MPLSRTTGIMLVVGLLLLAAAGYLLFRPSTEGSVTAVGTPASSAELTFLTLTLRIDPVTFDTSVLTDPRFMALVDIRTLIVPEPSGRPDPFAPFGGAAR